MKKLLSILATFGFTTTGATTVVACSKTLETKDLEEDNQLVESAQLLQKISDKIVQEFDPFFRDVVGTNNLENEKNLYKNLNENTKEYILTDKSEDNALKNVLLEKFNDKMNKINIEIANEYSNYYVDNVPISYDKTDVKIKLNYVDKAELKNSLNLSDDIKGDMARVDFELSYQIVFKKLTKKMTFNKTFNMGNDIDNIKVVLDLAIKKINAQLLTFAENLKTIDIKNNNSFEKLYDNFNIDYAKNYDDLNQIFQHLLKSNFTDTNFTFNESVKLIDVQSSIFANGLYHLKLEKSEAGNDNNYNKEVSLWTTLRPNSNNDLFLKQYKKFLAQYYKNVSLNSESGSLLLGQFSFNLNYLNFAGLTFTGIIKDTNDKTVYTNVSIAVTDFDAKLNNFINLIKEFYSFYKVFAQNIQVANYVFLHNAELYDSIWYGNKERDLYFSMKHHVIAKFIEHAKTNNMPDYEMFNFDDNGLGASLKILGASIKYWAGRYQIDFTFGREKFKSLFFPFVGGNLGMLRVSK